MAARTLARLLWMGVAAGILYTTVVVIGGLVTPGYSHIGQHVSSLYERGAAGGVPIATSFFAYNLLVAAFGLGVWRLVAQAGEPRQRLGALGGLALVLTAVAGAFDAVFRQDPVGAVATTAGALHIGFAAIASLCTIFAIGLVGAWALSRSQFRAFGWYSLTTLLVIGIFGPITALATANLWSTMGLLERVPIFGFIQWVVVASIVLAQTFARRRTAS